MKYFEVWGGDYLKKTLHLDVAEHGAYFMLMLAYYSDEKPLPSEPKKLYQICKAFTKSQRSAVDRVISEFFELQSDGFYHNSRCDAEIILYNEKIIANSKAGIISGKVRNLKKQKEKMNDRSDFVSTNGERNANPSTSTSLLSLSEFGFENFTQQVASTMGTVVYTGKEQNAEKLSAKLWNTAKTEPKTKEDWIRYIDKLTIMEK